MQQENFCTKILLNFHHFKKKDELNSTENKKQLKKPQMRYHSRL